MNVQTFEPRTEKEVANLKERWLEDPSWDIVGTPGFQYHREELTVFAWETKQAWAEQERREEAALTVAAALKADEMGCPGNLALGKYAIAVEGSLKELWHEIERLKDFQERGYTG